ncbi:MAG: Fic family protein [Candidatus Caenarcaniphilales bacterium]|nr:Fic family protein [Candidatus Caenarcaniphilales bacterium]
MHRGLQGHYIITTVFDESVKAFVPASLPPQPKIDWTPTLRRKFEQAQACIGKLYGVSRLLEEENLGLSLLVRVLMRKEAQLSSMIEGTQSSLSDLLRFEAGEELTDHRADVIEVRNYTKALDHGLQRVKKDNFPICSRLLREMHSILLAEGRGQDKQPGEFRSSQNWIGGTRPANATFVPPPSNLIGESMSNLENFLHDDSEESATVLEKAALAHLQFETIHPFLDGNGRIGRLLITLLLCDRDYLNEPVLYLSYYFKVKRTEYYRLLNQVRLEGDWESWLGFFADAVIVTTQQMLNAIERLKILVDKHKTILEPLGQVSISAKQVLNALVELPIASSNYLVKQTKLTPPTVNKVLDRLRELGIVKELTKQRRNRIYSYHEYMSILEEGTEPYED